MDDCIVCNKRVDVPALIFMQDKNGKHSVEYYHKACASSSARDEVRNFFWSDLV